MGNKNKRYKQRTTNENHERYPVKLSVTRDIVVQALHRGIITFELLKTHDTKFRSKGKIKLFDSI